MKSKDYRKTVFVIAVSLGVIGGGFAWFRSPGAEINARELGMIAALILVVAFALFLAFRRLKSVKEKLPAEDEMSRNILRRGAATSYYLSLYLWLVLMMLEDRLELEGHTLIGAGIMGMAILYALSWIYHRYIRPSHD